MSVRTSVVGVASRSNWFRMDTKYRVSTLNILSESESVFVGDTFSFCIAGVVLHHVSERLRKGVHVFTVFGITFVSTVASLRGRLLFLLTNAGHGPR